MWISPIYSSPPLFPKTNLNMLWNVPMKLFHYVEFYPTDIKCCMIIFQLACYLHIAIFVLNTTNGIWVFIRNNSKRTHFEMALKWNASECCATLNTYNHVKCEYFLTTKTLQWVVAARNLRAYTEIHYKLTIIGC